MIYLERETKMSEMLSPNGWASIETQGPGAVLGVRPTPLIQSFFGELPKAYGKKINPSEAHVTLVNSFDTQVNPNSLEKGLLSHVVDKMETCLAETPVEEIVLHPSTNELAKFGTFMVITLRKTQLLRDIRDSLAGIIYNELGVLLDSEGFTPHISVARLYRKHHKPKQFAPTIPEDIHIREASVGVRSYSDDHKRKRHPKRNKFHNVPPNYR